MFIYHFNRLIRSRILWGAFALVTVFAFVSVDSCVRGTRGDDPVGRLGGQAVEPRDLQRAEMFVRGIGRRRADLPPALVQTQAWEHLAALRTARELGLAVVPTEVRQTIREAPAFSVGGRFSEARYRATLQEALGVTPSIYESFMADQIALVKIASTLDAATWVAPMELQDELAAWTDRLTVQMVVISNRFADADLKLPESDLRAFYEADVSRFDVPDRVGVRFVATSVSNYLPFVQVTDDAIENHYDDNASRYTQASTNGLREQIPLPDVHDAIAAELSLAEARYMAGTNASHGFLATVQQMTSAAAFEKLAGRMGLAVQTSGLFSAKAFLPGIDPDAMDDFREAAFDLDAERADSRYAVVEGGAFVYVIAAMTNSPAHTPAFEQVIEQIRPMALAEARDKAFDDDLKKVHASLRLVLSDGKSFRFSAAAQSLNVATSLTFSAHAVSRGEFPHSYAVVPAAMRLQRGEISEPTRVSEGAVVVYLADREPGDPLSGELLRTQLRESLARRRQGALVPSWMKWNLARIGHAPARTYASEAGGDDRETDDEEE